ncbi:MAG: helix-turn-helix transcriptional regulator [Clostridia bacterium]|nr:helix-turn-helix transcriptional regulator [Clostridia bacterium]
MEFIRIRNLREDRDLYQKDIAKILGTSQQYYSEYENGKRPIPIAHLINLANFYNVSLDYLVGLTDEIKPYPRNYC